MLLTAITRITPDPRHNGLFDRHGGVRPTKRASWRASHERDRRRLPLRPAPEMALRPATKAYVACVGHESVSERCATRFIKRFLARHIWHPLEHPPPITV